MKTNGKVSALKKDDAPKIEIIDGEFIMLNGEYLMPIEEDDAELRKFLRKCLPELWEVMKPYHDRLKAGEKLNLIELFGMFEMWREHMSFLWMGHSPRQQPAFENLIREDWLAVREAQQRIYDKCVAELERRKAVS
jgi:hypothetical protein